MACTGSSCSFRGGTGRQPIPQPAGHQGYVLSRGLEVPYGTPVASLTPDQYERILGRPHPSRAATAPTTPTPSPMPTPSAKPAVPTPLDEFAGHRGKALPTPPVRSTIPSTGMVAPSMSDIPGLSMTGPQFTQRDINIPQPNSLEAFKYGTPGTVQQFPRFTPEQESAMYSLLQSGLGGLNQTPLNFEPIAERARKQFAEQTVPSLAERFTALGGGQRSSAFGQQLGQAGADLESQLAQLGSQYNLQKFGALRGLTQMGLEPAYETAYFPAQPGALQQFAQGAAGAIPAGVDLLGNAIKGAYDAWSSIGTPPSEEQAAQQIAAAVPPQVKQGLISRGYDYFKNVIFPAIIPTLTGAAGGLLGSFPVGPAAIFAALLGGGLGLAHYLTK